MGEKVVVYTAVFGNYDQLRPIKLPDGWLAYCYTDNLNLKVSGWDMLYQTNNFLPKDPKLAARRIKIIPFEMWGRSIWIDANLEYLGDWNDLNKPGFWAMQHNERDCVYDEITACLHQKKETKEKLMYWRGILDSQKFPKHYGLHATGVLIRENSPEIRAFCEKWWKNVQLVSHRDQLTFDFTRKQTGIEIQSFPFLDGFKKHRHLK